MRAPSSHRLNPFRRVYAPVQNVALQLQFYARRICCIFGTDHADSGVCLISSTVPTEDQILVPETLLKKRKSQEKAREEKSAEQQKKKKVSAL